MKIDWVTRNKLCVLTALVTGVASASLAVAVEHALIREVRTYNLVELDVEGEKQKLPLNSAIEAARFAVQSGKYELSPDMKDSGWRVRAERLNSESHHNDGVWSVSISSTYLPRYFCLFEFTAHGKWILEDYCSQNGK